jgi:hypothetical protein
VNQAIDNIPYEEMQPFKLYVGTNSASEKEIYETLIKAFSEVDSRARPWCGIKAKVDLLAVSPTNLTLAVIEKISGSEKGLVHVPQNWREPWQLEPVGSERRPIESNPCEQAERAVSVIKNSLRSFRKSNDDGLLPCIKCLIIFPDGYDFEGPKDFSVLDHDEVVTINLRNVRDLPKAILQPTQQERLDSRKYRKWIETGVLSSNDDSVLGTWLDPAFDPPDPEVPNKFWCLSHPRHREVPAEEEELSSSDGPRATPLPRKFKGRQLKLAVTVITGILIGMVSWRLHDRVRPIPSASYSLPSVSSPRPEDVTKVSQVIQAPMPQDKLSLQDDSGEAVPAPEPTKAGEVREPELTGEKSSERVKKPRSQTPPSEDSELKRKKIERQIHNAILLRAINGVTVHFAGETAYLDGRVETENQKSAAEKAARSIPGVEELRNSIQVNHVSSADMATP